MAEWRPSGKPHGSQDLLWLWGKLREHTRMFWSVFQVSQMSCCLLWQKKCLSLPLHCLPITRVSGWLEWLWFCHFLGNDWLHLRQDGEETPVGPLGSDHGHSPNSAGPIYCHGPWNYLFPRATWQRANEGRCQMCSCRHGCARNHIWEHTYHFGKSSLAVCHLENPWAHLLYGSLGSCPCSDCEQQCLLLTKKSTVQLFFYTTDYSFLK